MAYTKNITRLKIINISAVTLYYTNDGTPATHNIETSTLENSISIAHTTDSKFNNAMGGVSSSSERVKCDFVIADDVDNINYLINIIKNPLNVMVRLTIGLTNGESFTMFTRVVNYKKTLKGGDFIRLICNINRASNNIDDILNHRLIK